MDFVQALLPFTGTLVGVINILITRARMGQEEQQRLIAVSNAISNALEQTDAYREYLAAHKLPQTDREIKLAVLWRTAGDELNKIAKTSQERELAHRLRTKALAWEYYEEWSDERIMRARIDFETVREQLMELKRLSLGSQSDES
jgi:hypothetical protein